jgi:hypothetical protein
VIVAALFVDVARGPYPSLPLVDCWGLERDARTYAGPWPVVAHPPCGPWGRLAPFCTKQDRGAALLAVDVVRRWGGVLEHPSGSRLWREAGLPVPGDEGEIPRIVGREWSIAVDQCRWGHPCTKRTWLFFCGLNPHQVAVPDAEPPRMVIETTRGRSDLPRLPKSQRHLTPHRLARWLVAAARCSTL